MQTCSEPPVGSAHLPNADILAALGEGERIATDPTRKTYDILDDFWADHEK